MTAAQTIEAYDALVAKALRICAAPGHTVGGDEQYARLRLGGEDGVLCAPSITEVWHEGSVSRFPAWLLTASDAEVEAWVAERKEAKRIEREGSDAHLAFLEAARRHAEYERMKREFGDA